MWKYLTWVFLVIALAGMAERDVDVQPLDSHQQGAAFSMGLGGAPPPACWPSPCPPPPPPPPPPPSGGQETGGDGGE